MQMYYSLVQPVFSNGCELFGFREHNVLERVQRKYLRWILGLAPWTKSVKECVKLVQSGKLQMAITKPMKACFNSALWLLASDF